MPGMDRTGPLGTGPIGRGMGPCGSGQAGFGRGRGFRRGGGIGWLENPVPLSQEEEKKTLEQQKNFLERQIEAISKKLTELS